MEKNISSNTNKMNHTPFFVYGTLMKNFRNHNHIFKNISILDVIKGELEGAKLFHFDMGFPGIYESNNKNDNIKGELILLNELVEENYNLVMKKLDYLEGFTTDKKPNYDYIRKKSKIKISQPESEFIEAWVYWCNLDLKKYENFEIEDGDWRKFMENENNRNLFNLKEDNSGHEIIEL